jgi:hypothetical protein
MQEIMPQDEQAGRAQQAVIAVLPPAGPAAAFLPDALDMEHLMHLSTPPKAVRKIPQPPVQQLHLLGMR